MLKKCIALATVAAFATPTFAADSPFYVGGQVGATKSKISAGNFSEDFDFTTLSVLAGYNFTDNFALEARLGTGIKSEKYRDGNYTDEYSVRHKQLLLLRGNVPISDAFSLYGLAGLGAVKLKYEEQYTLSTDTGTIKADGFSWGVGAQLNINNNWAANVEYVQLPEKTFRDDLGSYKLKTNSVSLGIVYQF